MPSRRKSTVLIKAATCDCNAAGPCLSSLEHIAAMSRDVAPTLDDAHRQTQQCRGASSRLGLAFFHRGGTCTLASIRTAADVMADTGVAMAPCLSLRWPWVETGARPQSRQPKVWQGPNVEIQNRACWRSTCRSALLVSPKTDKIKAAAQCTSRR